MGDHRIVKVDDDGIVVWTGRLTAIVVGLAALLGGAAFVARRLAADGAAKALGLIAAVALIVAVAGRASTVRNRRWAGVEQPPPSRVRVRGGRVVVPRRDVKSGEWVEWRTKAG
ncbi:hypothetical protein ODJ79_39295 [Actinoplanes sp. KI2]|uniref:hypothetical protein n=1 Tax=Actinoplanes sp. KI2 TaxID=2983315 RepID=UPI0021D5D009|nr:hypothetical protein [Actinoplanes sp. KI2]MCU7729801.1 hypothetical protein [Actinoplanes sp. KI2]